MAQYILLSDDYPLQRKRPTTFGKTVNGLNPGVISPLNRCQQLPAPYKRLIADNNKTDKQ